MLGTIAGRRRPSAGSVRIDGQDTFEHPRLMRQIGLVGSPGPGNDGYRVRDMLRLAATLRPAWDPELADALQRRFDLSSRKSVMALSRGQRAALAVTIGLASRTPVTMFDEAHLGMDAPSRYAFYDALLEDYTAHPRTIIVSTRPRQPRASANWWTKGSSTSAAGSACSSARAPPRSSEPSGVIGSSPSTSSPWWPRRG